VHRAAAVVLGSVAVMGACGYVGGETTRGVAVRVDRTSPTILDIDARLPAEYAFSGEALPSTAAPEAAVGAVAVGAATAPAQRLASSPPHRLTVVFTGDTLPHSPVVQQAWSNGGSATFDFAPFFARVAPIISSADLAVCHLETPIAPFGEALTTAPTYGVPAEVATGLAVAGYDRCSTASNHSIDRGTRGIDATVSALEASGLGQSGMARTADESISPVVTVAGVAVAHLSYTFGFNGFHLPAAEPWRSNLIDAGRIIADAADARSRGADVVIVSLHWGVERAADPTPFQREVAEAVTASGVVDLIVGHHAHVLQPIESVNGHWVAFGLGNFLSNMPTGDSWPASSQDGAVLSVTIERRPDGSFEVLRPVVIPTWVDRTGGFVIRPVVSDLADPTVDDAVKAQLAESLSRTSAVLGAFIAGQ
jgi:Bacterial capsule synthesis protein PGA_cap